MLNNLFKSNIVFVYLGNFFITGISFLRNILTAKILSVDLYNSWVMLNTQMQYANNFDIGINNGALVNSLESKNSINKINMILSTSFITINLQIFFVTLFLFLYFYLFDLSKHLMIVLVFSFIVNSYTNFTSLLMRLLDKFKLNSIYQLFSLILSILLILFFWLTNLFDFNIYLIAYSYIFGLLITYIYPSLKFFKKEYLQFFSKKILLNILKNGSVLTLNSFIFLILISIDRFFIDNNFINIFSSLFSFASVFAVSLFMLPSAISNVIINNSLRNYVDTNILIIKNTVISVGVFFFIFTFLMIIFFYYFVNIILSDFLNSIHLFSIIISSLSILFFYNISQIISIGEKILFKTTLINFVFIFLKFVLTLIGFKFSFFSSIYEYCLFSLIYNFIYGVSFFLIQNKIASKKIYDVRSLISILYIFLSITFLSQLIAKNNILDPAFYFNLANLILILFLFREKITLNIKNLILRF